MIYDDRNSLPLQICSCRVIGPFIRIMRKPGCRVADALRMDPLAQRGRRGRGANREEEEEVKRKEEKEEKEEEVKKKEEED